MKIYRLHFEAFIIPCSSNPVFGPDYKYRLKTCLKWNKMSFFFSKVGCRVGSGGLGSDGCHVTWTHDVADGVRDCAG